jgi:hypothetical protein
MISMVVKAIGNHMGRFLDIDEKTLNKEITSIPKICVELNLSDGLRDAMDIEIGRWIYQQLGNYVQNPFKSTICKEYGHLKRKCPHKDVNDKDMPEKEK